jgi:hypothetical protein
VFVNIWQKHCHLKILKSTSFKRKKGNKIKLKAWMSCLEVAFCLFLHWLWPACAGQLFLASGSTDACTWIILRFSWPSQLPEIAHYESPRNYSVFFADISLVSVLRIRIRDPALPWIRDEFFPDPGYFWLWLRQDFAPVTIRSKKKLRLHSTFHAGSGMNKYLDPDPGWENGRIRIQCWSW